MKKCNRHRWQPWSRATNLKKPALNSYRFCSKCQAVHKFNGKKWLKV
jgi:hypothetical protein